MHSLSQPIENRPSPQADSVTVRLAAAQAAAVAGELRRLQVRLSGGVAGDGWSGAARLAFDEQIAARAGVLGPVIQRYDGYAAALQTYAYRLSEVEGRLRVRPADGAPDPLWNQAWEEWDEARRRCRDALGVAGRIGADRHGLSRLWHAVEHGAHEVLDHLSLKQLSVVLADLGDALLVAGLILSAVFPPAAGAVWAALAVVSVAQLIVDGTRRARGDSGVGWTDVAWDAAGVLPLGKLLRGARTADEASRIIETLPEAERSSRIVPGGLMSHEARGGHLNARHIRKSKRFLLSRFKKQPYLRWASSFKDRQTAERASAWLLDGRGAMIKAWLANPIRPLVLEGDFGSYVGRCYAENGTMVKATKLRLVLTPEASPLGFNIKTGHPSV